MTAAVTIPAPPEPFPLVIQGTAKPVAYACPGCGALFTTYMFGGGPSSDPAAKHMASTHCHRFCGCGASLNKSRTKCDACWGQSLAEREKKVFEKAKRLTIEEYPNQAVYWDGGIGDGLFLNIDDLLDRCEEEGVDLPEYAWAAKEVPLAMNADWLIERALEEHGEGAREEIADKNVPELQNLLDSWCTRQDLKSWQPDYTTAVLLHPQE